MLQCRPWWPGNISEVFRALDNTVYLHDRKVRPKCQTTVSQLPVELQSSSLQAFSYFIASSKCMEDSSIHHSWTISTTLQYAIFNWPRHIDDNVIWNAINGRTKYIVGIRRKSSTTFSLELWVYVFSPSCYWPSKKWPKTFAQYCICLHFQQQKTWVAHWRETQ